MSAQGPPAPLTYICVSCDREWSPILSDRDCPDCGRRGQLKQRARQEHTP